MSTSADHLKVDRDRGIPVGAFAGADVVVDDVYTDAGGELEPEPDDLLLMISIMLARILAIISAALFESEPDEFKLVAGGFKIHGSLGTIANSQRGQLTTTASLQSILHIPRLFIAP